MKTWKVPAVDVEAMSGDFADAQSLIVLRSERTLQEAGQRLYEGCYYLSSREAAEHPAAQRLGLIRGHRVG